MNVNQPLSDDLEPIEIESLPASGSPLEREWLLPERTRTRLPVINVVLFFLTLLTTTLAGTNNALGRAVNPFTEPMALVAGLPFSMTLMTILLVHELGHYVMSRIHGVRATLPYFIPGPPFLVGTFGAFIRMKSPPLDRRALFDVGAAGPWAGVLVAIPAVIIGLHLSEVRPLQPFEYGFFFGDSILFKLLTRAVIGVSPDEVTILLHPVAMAGWLGLFVTFLNLIPVGQLDGGHVSYALLGTRHYWPARVFVLVIFVLGFQGWSGWFLWTFLLLVLGIRHPPTLDRFTPLDRARRIGAWATLGLFIMTFMPVPFAVKLPPSAPVSPPRYEGPATPVGMPMDPRGERQACNVNCSDQGNRQHRHSGESRNLGGERT